MGIFERSTVSFGTSLFEHHIHDLLEHLHSNLGVRDTQYNVSQARSIPPLEDLEPDELVARGVRGIELSGAFYPDITKGKKVPMLMPFRGYRETGTDSRKLDGIRFETTPGYDESDTPREDLEFMDLAREITEKYVRKQKLA